VANYPMYRGVAQLVGMDMLAVVGSLAEQITLMSAHWDDYDYFFAHEKRADRAAPTQLSAHSWHPVPTLLWGPHVGRDAVERFGERACATGMLGHLRTQDLMPLMLASAGRLEKYGA